METKVGQIAFKAREFIVAEVLEGESPEAMKLVGYCLMGPRFWDWEVFPSLDAALSAARRILPEGPVEPVA